MRTPLKSGTRKARFTLTGLALAALVAIPSTVAAACWGLTAVASMVSSGLVGAS